MYKLIEIKIIIIKMERIEKLNRNQVLKELQTYNKYQSKTQKEIASQFDGVVALRNELKKLEKRKNKEPNEEDNEKDVKDKKKKHKKKNQKEDDCLVLLIWERKDRGDDVSTILLARDMTMLKKKFKDYYMKHREDDDYLDDDDFEKYSNNSVNMLDKMAENDTKAPEFNSAYIITLKHSTL